MSYEYIRLLASVIFMLNCVPEVRPESKPAEVLPFAARYVHGSAKLD